MMARWAGCIFSYTPTRFLPAGAGQVPGGADPPWSLMHLALGGEGLPLPSKDGASTATVCMDTRTRSHNSVDKVHFPLASALRVEVGCPRLWGVL
eukprot:gene13429-biopygen492